MSDDGLSRRTLLGTGLTAGSLLLAGCSGSDSTGTPTGSDPFGGTGGSGPGSATDGGGDGGEETGDSDRPSVVVGQRVLRDSIGFLVEGTARYDDLGGQGTAPSGREYLVVVLAVKNRGDEAIEMSDLSGFEVTDGEGTTRDRLDLVSQTGSQFTRGLLVPGETIRGFVAFEVAAGSQGWAFGFDVDAPQTSLERVTVDLGDRQRPESVFRQSLGDSVHEVGESVTAADLTVTVTEVRTADSVGNAAAGSNKEFLLPTVRVENGKDRTAYVGLTGQMLLTGERGTPQALDLGAQQQLDGAFPLNPNVEPGKHVAGEVPYVVDGGDGALYFAYDFTSNGAARKAIWKLR